MGIWVSQHWGCAWSKGTGPSAVSASFHCPQASASALAPPLPLRNATLSYSPRPDFSCYQAFPRICCTPFTFRYFSSAAERSAQPLWNNAWSHQTVKAASRRSTILTQFGEWGFRSTLRMGLCLGLHLLNNLQDCWTTTTGSARIVVIE